MAFDGDDLRTISLGLRVFAQNLLAECRRDKGQDIPADVTEQSYRLNAIAERIGRQEGMEFGYDAFIRRMCSGAEQIGEGEPLAIASLADWRATSAALAFIAKRLVAAGDNANGGRLKDLSERAEAGVQWCEGFLDCARRLTEPQTELAQDD